MRPALLALLIALPLPALAQKAPTPAAPASTGVLRHLAFGEVIRLPAAFASAGGDVPDHQNLSQNGFIAEYIPRGERIDSWTRLTTFTGNRGLARGTNGQQAARDTLTRLQGLYRSACIGALDYHELTAPPVPGARATAAAWVSCSHVAATGAGEDVVALILVTGENVFSVQLATRGAARPQAVPRDPADWAARLAHLAQARVCTPAPGEAAPYPSCN